MTEPGRGGLRRSGGEEEVWIELPQGRYRFLRGVPDESVLASGVPTWFDVEDAAGTPGRLLLPGTGPLLLSRQRSAGVPRSGKAHY